jgi:hypothetical protein
MNTKPREFDLYWDGESQEAHICETSVQWNEKSNYAKPDFHVIEHSALEQLQRELDDVKHERHILRTIEKELQQENSALREILREAHQYCEPAMVEKHQALKRKD